MVYVTCARSGANLTYAISRELPCCPDAGEKPVTLVFEPPGDDYVLRDGDGVRVRVEGNCRTSETRLVSASAADALRY